MKVSGEMFQESQVGIQEGPVKITGADYRVFIGKDKTDKNGKIVKQAYPWTALELEMMSLDDDGNTVGDVDRKRYSVCFASERNPVVDFAPSAESSGEPAPNADGDLGPPTDPKDPDTGSHGPFLEPTNPKAQLRKFGSYYKLVDNIEALIGVGEFPEDCRELIGAIGEIETITEKDEKRKDDDGNPIEYHTQLFTKLTFAKKGGKTGAKAGAKTTAAKKTEAKPKAQAEEEGGEGEGGADAADNALSILKAFCGKQKSGTKISINKLITNLALSIASYKGADKDEVKTILKDPDSLEALADQAGFSVDGKEVTFA